MLTNPFDDTLQDDLALPDVDEISPNLSPSAGKNSAKEQGQNIPVAWKPTVQEPVPVVRCTSNKRDGTRCGRWSIRGHNVCLSHGGYLPNVREHAQAVVDAARMRLIGLSDMAIDAIEDIVENATSDAVRLKAATEVLDRAGLKGAPDLHITVEHTESASDVIAARLKAMALRMAADRAREQEPEDLGEVEDAEVVDEPEEPAVS